jgi:hypothetical protein
MELGCKLIPKQRGLPISAYSAPNLFSPHRPTQTAEKYSLNFWLAEFYLLNKYFPTFHHSHAAMS